MTALMPDRTRPSAGELGRDLRHRRPLVLLATLAGVVAAGSTLLVCLGLGVAGWFLTDAGAHGTPSGGLRVGAIAWLMGHGSGVHVEGTAVTVMPLGITLVCGWVTWRLGHRLGDSISGHGPDADRIADGERDWTVPAAGFLFAVGYGAVAVATTSLAQTAGTGLDSTRVVLFSIVLCGLLATPGIAIGSGRAAIWTATLSPSVLATAAACRRVLTTWLLAALVAFVVALALDYDTALNVLSQLDTDTGATVLVGAVSLLVVPNAAVFSGSYLLGPGFTVGVHTIVSPAVVTIGALPAFPLLAALPDTGPTPSWTAGLAALAPVVAVIGVVRAQRAHPTYRYEEGALHGGGGGMLAGFLFGVLALLAGGAVGPGRMSDVGPLAAATLLHGVVSFGIGGLLGGVLMTWWQRRGLEPAPARVEGVDDRAVDEPVRSPSNRHAPHDFVRDDSATPALATGPAAADRHAPHDEVGDESGEVAPAAGPATDPHAPHDEVGDESAEVTPAAGPATDPHAPHDEVGDGPDGPVAAQADPEIDPEVRAEVHAEVHPEVDPEATQADLPAVRAEDEQP